MSNESVAIEDEIDPSRMDYDEWVAGQYEWEKEGHDVGDIPLERSKWEALLRRRAARLARERAAAKEKLRLEQRQAAIESLKPPPCDVVADAKSIDDAEVALSEAKEKLFGAWDQKFNQLPIDVTTAWRVYNDDIDGNGFYLRPRTPRADDFPTDLTEIRSGLANPEYERFQRYSRAVLQQLDALEANLEHALNPPAGTRPLLKGWSLNEIDENDGSVWPVPGLVPHGLTSSTVCRKAANHCGRRS
jgi:hypothetical protein